jgi:hypothetical protein
MSESYEVGTRAWQTDPVEGWVPSEVEQKIVEGDKLKLVFRLENGEVRCLPSSAVNVWRALDRLEFVQQSFDATHDRYACYLSTEI